MATIRKVCALSVFGVLLAACATAPKEPVSRADPAAAGSPEIASAAPIEAPPASPSETDTAAGAEGRPEPSLVVDLNREPPADDTGQVCRVMLRPNTNSLVNVCGTPAQWKRYREAEARQAQDLLLRMQMQTFR